MRPGALGRTAVRRRRRDRANLRNVVRTSGVSVADFYDWLSRFQDWARRAGHDTGRAELTVHRRLRTAAGAASGAVVHEQLLATLRGIGAPLAQPRVLDAGCGLGGTTFFLHDALGGRYVGITLSEGQRSRAAAEAQRRGVAASCRFAVRSYDADLRDLLPSGADLVVAIESLAHAPDPTATIARLAAVLEPGGCLAIVDDMPLARLPADDPDFAAFRRGWLCPAIASAETVRAAVAAAGLTLAADVDLTPLMPLREPRSLERLIRLNAALQTVSRATPARTLVESLHGGLMLERLYHRRRATYRLVVGRRPAQG